MSNNDRNLLEFLGVSQAALPTVDANSLDLSNLLFNSISKFITHCKYYDLKTSATNDGLTRTHFHYFT